jgi:lipoic acid synthetase
VPRNTVPPELPILSAPPAAGRMPRWLKRPVPKGNFRHFTAELVEDLALETVCEHARCPNRMECYAQKTATFMILGNVCTRACSFCSVSRGRPQPVDPDEPRRVAEAARRLGLQHVVITSVTRDDLADGGAAHFVACIQAVRQATAASVEVLTPDFRYHPAAIDQVAAAAPEVFNHNTETVPRLYRPVRGPQAEYRRTLALLRRVKTRDPRIKVKSGLMLGMGESRTELLDVLADLLDYGCEYLTLGQYLQPDPSRYLPVARYLPPDEFETLGEIARQLGFARVASGPFVRSSYHARDMALPA